MTSARRAETRSGLQMLLGAGAAGARSKANANAPAPVPATGKEARKVEHAPSAANGAPQLPLGAIDPDPEQPRKTFDEESLNELAESIKEVGVLQPITVRVNPKKSGRYLIMTGERRYRAAKLAGLTSIPALVGSPEAQRSLREVQMIENIHRDALTPMEIAAYLREKLIEGRKKGEIAALIKKSPAFVSRHLSLVNLPKVLQDTFDTGRCSDVSVMYELRLLHKEAPEKTERWLSKTCAELTRGALTELRGQIRGGEGDNPPPPSEPAESPAKAESKATSATPGKATIDDERSETFSRLLGTRVQVESKQIRITILNPEELQRIEQIFATGAKAAV